MTERDNRSFLIDKARDSADSAWDEKGYTDESFSKY